MNKSGVEGLNHEQFKSLTSLSIIANKSSVFLSLALVCQMFLSSLVYAQSPVIGKVIFSEGDSVVKRIGESSSSLDYNDEILLTDLIKTLDDGILTVSFSDGAEVTLRPSTTLFVKEYDDEKSTISLLSGGIRVISGGIVRRDANAFKVITTDGEVTAKKDGSDFTVRICSMDCDDENRQLSGAAPNTESSAIAKIVALQGQVNVFNQDKRRLAVGDAVFNTEKLVSGDNSYAQLLFVDGSSVTLQAKSSLGISDFKFDQTGYEDVSIFSLIEGGLRFVTGLIGKKDRTAFRLNTSVATIGIRGTDFSINCIGNCSSGGIVTYVSEGSISHENSAGKYIAGEGDYTTITSSGSSPVTTTTPVNFENNIAPPPSDAPIDMDSLFASSADSVDPGTYLGVESGQVSIIGAADEAPVIVDASLSAYILPSGSVSDVEGLNSFQTINTSSTSSSFVSGDSNSDINTIVIGDSVAADTISGTAAVATAVIQEQTIASPY